MFAVPASVVNSGLEYLNNKLYIMFRHRISSYLNKKYLEGMVFYQLSNLDSRITNPDQKFTQDIEKWSKCLSNLYSNLTKPILDIFLFSKKLSELVGFEGPAIIIGWYFFSGFVIRFVSPPFGKLASAEQEKEGYYRTCHSDLVNHSEEITFYRGNEWEKQRTHVIMSKLVKKVNEILFKRFYMGVFDGVFAKYGATMISYAVLGLPVFGRKNQNYSAVDTGTVTRDYIRNSSLLINLAKAVGRIVISYKDLQSLAGYTGLIYDLKEVLDDLEVSKFKRSMVEGSPYTNSPIEGKFIYDDCLAFENVPIVSPNGDVLVENLNIKIERGMHTFIQGPNGCGKSSLFRILGELWPLYKGVVYKPRMEEMFYIPQRPYFPHGTLRDQIIYPHTHQQMLDSGATDPELLQLMEIVQLSEVVEKKGLDHFETWNDTLSGGQKQKLAMCRLLYHRPKFAILDECTSAVSMEAERIIYEEYKARGITLITVSHRESLLKYHDYILKFDGRGGWNFYKLLFD